MRTKTLRVSTTDDRGERRPALAVLALALLPMVQGCSPPSPSPPLPSPWCKGEGRTGCESFSVTRIGETIKVLSSDAFGGRQPGTPGETATIDYLSRQLKQLGLAPGNQDGTYVQPVSLSGIKSDLKVTMSGEPWTEGSKSCETNKDCPPSSECSKKKVCTGDYVVFSESTEPSVDIKDSEVVFVGYGVEAREDQHWDDYKGVDVRGKTLLMLIDDPQIPDPRDASKLDATRFGGKEMTYYGRWTYKHEIAAKKGAAAVIILHTAHFAEVVGKFPTVWKSFQGERFIGAEPHAKVEGWVSEEKARRIFAMANMDFDQLQQKALREDFAPVNLGIKVSFEGKNTVRAVQSNNVIARLDGSDPVLKNEYVLYTAHWDHLGTNSDGIFHGAMDNASGVAMLLELATAFSKLPTRPRRSILFMAPTAEEYVLLGARSFALNPLPPYDLSKIQADINMDCVNVWKPTKDVGAVGLRLSTLGDRLDEVATAQGRVAHAESRPETGTFFRADHIELAKKGVPAVDVQMGDTFVGEEEGSAKRRYDTYKKAHYHDPSDTIEGDWTYLGAVADGRLLLELGWNVAQASGRQEWKDVGAAKSFRVEREKSLRAR